MGYFDHFGVVGGGCVHSDVYHLQHAGAVVAGVVLLETVVLCGLAIVLDGEGVLPIFLVDLGDAFLGLGYVRHSVGGDVELD